MPAVWRGCTHDRNRRHIRFCTDFRSLRVIAPATPATG